MTITEFLLARVAEDEAEARDAMPDGEQALQSWLKAGDAYEVLYFPARVLAECEAKRRIVARCQPVILPADAPEVPQAAWDAMNVLNAATCTRALDHFLVAMGERDRLRRALAEAEGRVGA